MHIKIQQITGYLDEIDWCNKIKYKIKKDSSIFIHYSDIFHIHSIDASSIIKNNAEARVIYTLNIGNMELIDNDTFEFYYHFNHLKKELNIRWTTVRHAIFSKTDPYKNKCNFLIILTCNMLNLDETDIDNVFINETF